MSADTAQAQYSRIGLRQIVVAPVLGTVLGIVLVIVFATVWMTFLIGSSDGQVDFGQASESFQGSFHANMAIIAGIYVPTIALLWWAARSLTPPPAVRFFRPLGGRTIGLAALSGILLAGACLVLEMFLSRTFGITFEMTPAERSLIPADAVQFVIALAVIGFVGPFAEEFYFRGFLLSWLRQFVGTTGAVLLSSAAFALVHVFMLLHPGASGWVTTGEIFGVGLVMALWVVRSGSLWSSFALHLAYNSSVVVQMYLLPA